MFARHNNRFGRGW
ncbi:hypothetical protein TFKS16_1015 [Tannerella forsythia KS16]|nr:hypothetical protein TF3313_1085 [Tannerella forsythia 3313]BAR51295.1 hypothetical protein TFKS16_1015 [Tannerella forsythia KS16]